MKREKLSGFILGVLSCVMVLSLVGGALAASGMTITIDPTIKVMVNGSVFQPKDVNGNDVMVFVYDGTTYAPLRALAEAYGLEVGYDAVAKMATIDSPLADVPADQFPDQAVVPSTGSGRIYVTETGRRYHYDPNCNGGTYYESTLEDALRRGLTPCDKCVR